MERCGPTYGTRPGKSRRGDAMIRRAPGLALMALALACWPGTARAQVFIASQPHPEFTIGPLFVRASVDPSLGPVSIDIFWSLVIPPERTVVNLDQDLFLLWPSEILDEPGLGKPDRALAEFVEKRGF